jgi:hypothetical protein
MQGNSTSTNGSATVINGRGIHHRKLSRRQRVQLAADLANGAAAVRSLTVKQAAALTRVPVLDVSRARRNGKPTNGSNGRNGHETLAEHIARCSATERLEAARVIGPVELWDTMIEPIVSEDRATISTL